MDKNEKNNNKILKKMEIEKAKIDKKVSKEKITPKVILTKIKETFIKDTNKTILLVAILIILYIVINLGVRAINLAQIDLTTDKLYSLTEQSKVAARNVQTDIKFYIWNISDTDQSTKLIDLLKQYNSENKRITYEIISPDDTEKLEKFDLESTDSLIVGESSEGRKSFIYSYDLYTYDSGFNIVDITEQKLTNAILNLSGTEPVKVFFVEGRTEYSLEERMNNLNQALSTDFYTVNTINIISNPTIPEECEVLVIMGLVSDFTEEEAANICNYIEKGGDIIITGEINRQKAVDFPNFQKILDEYYVKLPNKAVVEAGNRTVSGYTNIFQTNISSDNEITRVLFNYTASTGENITPLFIDAGIVEVDYTSTYSNNVKASTFITTSNGASLSALPEATVEPSTGESYALGVSFIKTVESGDESRAVIYSTTRSFSDYSIDGGNTPMFAYNGNIIVNSFAYVSNRGELYSIRKSQSFIPYTATKEEDRLVRLLISAIPSAIGVLGVCVWINRRRLK